MRAVRELHAPSQPELRQLVATHIRDLVARRSARRARRGAVANRHQVSARYVQTLFEADGTTFTGYVRDQRLAYAHHMLSNAAFAGHSVSAIAFDAGFGDLSHFNRDFRRR